MLSTNETAPYPLRVVGGEILNYILLIEARTPDAGEAAAARTLEVVVRRAMTTPGRKSHPAGKSFRRGGAQARAQ
jgi:hypothetical protein